MSLARLGEDDSWALVVTIPGSPVGAARPRFRALHNKAGKYLGASTHKEKKHASWEALAIERFEATWQGSAPLDEPVVVDVLSLHARPKRLCRKSDPRERVPCCAKPDADNIAKLVLDAMKAAGVFVDDSRVVCLNVTKLHVSIDEKGSPAEAERVVVRMRGWE